MRFRVLGDLSRGPALSFAARKVTQNWRNHAISFPSPEGLYLLRYVAKRAHTTKASSANGVLLRGQQESSLRPEVRWLPLLL
jgi:hypothetical protein